MKTIEYFVMGSIALLISACHPKSTPDVQLREFVPPSQEALQEAESLQAQGGVEIHFSRLHGYVVSVLSVPALVDSSVPAADQPRPKPLEVSHGAFSAGRASALIKFISRNFKLFGLPSNDSGAKSELKVSIDQSNPEYNENDQEPNPTGVFSTRVEQYIGGIRLVGRYALGHFDSQGNLYALTSRLLPIDRSALQLTPAIQEKNLSQYMGLIFEELAFTDSSLMGWLNGINLGQPGVLYSVELVLLPEADQALAPVRLAYEVRVRKGMDEAVVHVDALTGEKLRAYNNLPTDWHNDAASLVTANALDETGTPQNILACRSGGLIRMGFGSNYHVGSVTPFNSNQWANIIDGADQWPQEQWHTPYSQAISPAAVSSFDPALGYTGAKPQMTSLMRNFKQTLDWWAARGWRSWDGRGSSMGMFVNARPNDDGTPSGNAWGGGGYITTGGFVFSPTKGSFANDLEVIGHEFMHNVLEATSGLSYYSESGALNEALADLFGVALTVDTMRDRLADAKVGSVVQIRDFSDPTLSGQPDRYSRFVVTEGDAAGVHTNSGILNKAHWLMIQGGKFNGVDVFPLGATKVIDFMRNFNRYGRVSRSTSMEEYASAVVGRCRIAAVFAILLGGDARALNRDCSMMERSLRAVELLGFAERADLSVDSANVYGDYVEARVTNQSSENLNLVDYKIDLLEGSALVATRLFDSTAYSDYQTAAVVASTEDGIVPGTLSWLKPGGAATVRLRYKNALELGDAVLYGPRSLILKFTRVASGTDINVWNNQIPVRFSPELNGSSGLPETSGVMGGATFRAAHINQAMVRVAPTTSVLLTRDTRNGVFSVIPGSEQTLGAIAPTQDASSTTGAVTGLFRFPMQYLSVFNSNHPWTTPAVIVLSDIIRVNHPLGGATREVWFDETGGRDELTGRPQFYLLTDALDVVDEQDEGDNLMCLNCALSSTEYWATSIVRFPRGTSGIESLFPAAYAAAASKLRSLHEGELREVIETVGRAGLGFRR